jgi:hypothetical protein
MIARMLAAAPLAVDPGRNEAAGDQWAQQQMIDAQSGIAAKRVPEIFSSARRADSEPSCHVAAHIPGTCLRRVRTACAVICANRWDKTLASQAGSASTPRSPRRQAACRARGRRSPGLRRPGARSPPGRAFPRGADAKPQPRRSTACGPGRGARTVSNAACSSCAVTARFSIAPEAARGFHALNRCPPLIGRAPILMNMGIMPEVP